MEELNLLSPGALGDGSVMKYLGNPQFTSDLANQLDVDQDGSVRFSELLDVDRLLAAARRFAKIAENDAAVASVLRQLVERARADLQLGAGGEDVGLPAVQSCAIPGDARYMLDLAVGEPSAASLQVLRATVADLDPRPAPTGDIARPTEQACAATKRILLGMVDEMSTELRTGNIMELQQMLDKVRQIVDGAPAPPDLITGPAAARVRADLYQAIRLIAPMRDTRR